MGTPIIEFSERKHIRWKNTEFGRYLILETVKCKNKSTYKIKKYKFLTANHFITIKLQIFNDNIQI